MNRRPIVVAALSLLCAAAFATTSTLGASADTRILEFNPTQNFGASFLSTYNDSGNDQRTLMSFSLASIPSGNAISSATLRIFGDNQFGTGQTTISVFRLTRSFTEAQATWNIASTGNSWTTPGGDAVGTTGVSNTSPYASLSTNQMSDTWLEFDITQLVTEWHMGTHDNYGMLIQSSVGGRYLYTSREGVAGSTEFESNLPELVVIHDAVPEPATMTMFVIGALALRRRIVTSKKA
ncbi:MAG: DNRLRE domain-containing protein [Fimbriimonadaceae bacterium]|nr:DNRLRE domain-containing protein [Fimbriimonadaceae bacterium]